MVRRLEFHPVTEERTSPERLAALLVEARDVLEARGMVSMDEYGDMLKWGLPKRDGVWRNVHVFHPDWCSFSDHYWGTIHYHAGAIRGTVLAGRFEHHTYRATEHPDGDRFLDGRAYRLERHTRVHGAGTTYRLPAFVPHWLTPLELTLTYFEEDEADEMSDLVNPASEETDTHTWTQEQADALLPRLLDMIDERLGLLQPVVQR